MCMKQIVVTPFQSVNLFCCRSGNGVGLDFLDRLLIPNSSKTAHWHGVPTGIRTPVTAVKGRCPRPLDDGDRHLERSTSFDRCCREAQFYLTFIGLPRGSSGSSTSSFRRGDVDGFEAEPVNVSGGRKISSPGFSIFRKKWWAGFVWDDPLESSGRKWRVDAKQTRRNDRPDSPPTTQGRGRNRKSFR